MKLLKLKISNFRGIPALIIEADGKNVNIYGENGAGKTTTEDAFLQLLFGKDSADRKDYDLIPHIEGTTEPNIGNELEPTVEATLEYFGKTVSLKKVYAEEWPTKGAAKGQYAGSKMRYYVDELEVKAGEYQKVVDEMVDVKLFKLITNPLYFLESITWQERRAVLVSVAGDLSVELPANLAKSLDGRTFATYHALAKQRVKEINKQRDELPVAIKEARRLVDDTLDAEALRTAADAAHEALRAAQSSDADTEHRKALAELDAELLEAASAHRKKTDTLRETLDGLIIEELSNTRLIASYTADVAHAKAKVSRLADEKAELLKKWHAVNDTTYNGGDLCPTCGQELPVSQIDTARAAFNRQKSDTLEKLKAAGTAINDETTELTAQALNIGLKSDALTLANETLAGRIAKGKAFVEANKFEASKEYAEITARRAALVPATANAEQLAARRAAVQAADAQLAAVALSDKQKQRVEELEASEKEISKNVGIWEKAVNECEKHVKSMTKELEKAVNGKFDIARFQLFQTLKNGEEAECCNVIYPNGSTNLSTGERAQVGVDVINTLTKFYGVDAPIWIDNAEGITKFIASDSQLVRMYVSDHNAALCVEVEA